MAKVTFGVIVGNRGFFPDILAKEGRKEILEVLENEWLWRSGPGHDRHEIRRGRDPRRRQEVRELFAPRPRRSTASS